MEQPTAQDVVVEDNDPSIVYKGEWNVGTDPTLYTGESYHNTGQVGAWVAFPFTGSFIFYISDKNNDHGAFGVSIDNGPQTVLSSFNAELLKQQVLFSQAVSPGPHVINITNLDARFTGLDQFAYRPLPPDDPTSTPSSVIATTPSRSPAERPTDSGLPVADTADSDAPLPTGAYVGIGLGAAAVLILLAAAGFLLWQRRQRNQPSLAAQSWYVDGAPQQQSVAPEPQWASHYSPLDAGSTSLPYARSPGPPSYAYSSSHIGSHRSS